MASKGLVCVAWLLAACSSDGGGGVVHPPDAAPPPPDAMLGPTTVEFTQPAMDPVLSNDDTVTLQLVTTGAPPERIEVWRDGGHLVDLQPPYTYPWDTRLETDGEHQLEARAIVGGVAAATDTTTVRLDRVGPQLISHVPTQGADQVAVFEPIVLTFSEPLAAASITLSSFRLFANGTAVATTATVSPAGDVVTLQLALPIAALPAAGSVVVSANITDQAGNPMQDGSDFQFTYPLWLTRYDDDPALPADAIAVDVAVASDGTLRLLYAIQISGGWNLRVAALGASGWTIETVDLLQTGFSIDSRMVLDTTDRPVVVISGMDSYTWDGVDWIPTAIAAGPADTWDVVVAPDGDLVTARCNQTTTTGVFNYEVIRAGATELDFDVFFGGSVCRTDLMMDMDTPLLAYRDGYSCRLTSISSAIHTGFSGSACDDASATRGGDGELYAGRTVVATSDVSGSLRQHNGTSWITLTLPAYLGVLDMAPAPLGFYAAVTLDIDEIGVTNQAGDLYPGIAPPFRRLTTRNGRALVLTPTVLLELNQL